MNSCYEVRSFVPEYRDSLEDLYRAIYGEVWREKTSLDWTLDHPLAEAGAAIAVKGDVVVSAQPYCDFPLHTPWGTARTTLFLDVATRPDHQRRGLFRQVVSAATAAAFARGTSIIMTTPNRISFQGFQTLPGWVQLCSLDCMFLPLGAGDRIDNSGLFSLGLRGALSMASLVCKSTAQQRSTRQIRCNIETPWSPSSEADELWDRAVAHVGISVVRDRAFLRWRFGSNYHLFVTRNERGISGYAAARIISRAGLKIGMILDCVTSNDQASSLSLLSSVIAWLREQRASAAIGYFLRGSAPWHHVRTAGFVRIPSFCTPRDYPVCVNVRPGDSHSDDLLNTSHWHLSLADSDLA